MSEEYPFIDGLTETTEADQHCYDELMSHAIPFSIHWENLDDSMKTFQWDSEWEKYIKHRADLFDYEGREKYLPWNLYKDLNVQWIDGYNYTQRIGNCCGHAHKNALKTSNLVNARQTGKMPREIALCIAYGIARGNGTMRMGSGLNLNPMARWSATVGNFWTADFGKYDGGNRASKWRKGSPACANALKTQSIPVYLPTASFDLCYAACAAGFGINIGSGVYPTGSVPNGEGLATPSTWKNGGHAVALIAAYTSKSGRRYVYMENSHGARYAADSLNPNRQHGCWMEEKDIARMATTKYGIWYVNLGELG
ncbi:MAG: hypothetical protein FWG73_06510 [Planctomycetaceae bacterium]|nr:hypothetical protein [Planctomycetaceae bacterium]